jgi:hypothetical protein
LAVEVVAVLEETQPQEMAILGLQIQAAGVAHKLVVELLALAAQA